MFKISLKDVGVDRVTKDINVSAKDINGLMAVVLGILAEFLGEDYYFVLSVVGDEVNIIHCGHIAGSFTITKQN